MSWANAECLAVVNMLADPFRIRHNRLVSKAELCPHTPEQLRVVMVNVRVA